MSWIDDIRASSMHAVVSGETGYTLRTIFRWYSKTFATPLHVVDTLPMEDVIRAYWEVQYEDMSDDERAVEIARLIEPEEKLLKRRLEEDAEEADLFEYGKQAEADDKVKVVPPPPTPIDQIAGVTKHLGELTEKIKSITPEIQPDITMKFIESDEEFEELLDKGFGPPPKKNKGII